MRLFFSDVPIFGKNGWKTTLVFDEDFKKMGVIGSRDVPATYRQKPVPGTSVGHLIRLWHATPPP
jgi:hypothetical protein